MNTPNIMIDQVSLSYTGKQIFTDITLPISAGKWIALLGPSGVGKSSLIRIIAGLTTPQEQIRGRCYADNNIPLQQQVAYMAQTDLLLPWLTVLENATLGHRLRSANHPVCLSQATDLLHSVGLSTAASLYPHQLSGGMRQRVALVRTLMENKPIVLMDEPFSALDAITRYKLQALAAKLLQGKSVIFITHDPSEALRLAHDIYILQGQPATLKSVAHLTTPIPRTTTDATIIPMQALLFDALTGTAE